MFQDKNPRGEQQNWAKVVSTSSCGLRRLEIQRDVETLIGQPANYPTEMVEQLAKLFSARPAIKSAHLAYVFMAGTGDPGHNCIGIKAEGSLDEVYEAIVDIAKRYSHEGGILDLIEIDEGGKDAISRYMIKTNEPFYRCAT